MRKRMHRNSLEAYASGRVDLFPKRSREILECLERLKRAATDREIKDSIGFDDMNNVRPRITEMIEAGVLVEYGRTNDLITGKTVRLVDLKMRAGAQLSLL